MKSLLLASLLFLVGCGGSSAPTPAPSSTLPAASGGASPSATLGTAIVVKDFALDPADLEVSGPVVALDVTNAGPTIHNVTIRDDAGKVIVASRDLREGESETVTAEIPAGSYTMVCSLPGHESLGIKGTLIVTP